jgi:diguanylate cyclase (GGDEF)-like protein
MSALFPFAPQNLEEVRQQVLQRFAALLESQTRTQQFARNVGSLVRDVNAEHSVRLNKAVQLLDEVDFGQAEQNETQARLRAEIERVKRLDSTLNLLLDERERQWAESGVHLKEIMLDFNRMLEKLAGTLIEKDLFERQSQVLENIIISHEQVSHWQVFVQQILSNFHTIFPFNFFFIAFTEEHGLSLYLYFLGDYPDEVKSFVRSKVTRDMLEKLKLPVDTLTDIEEFDIHARSDFSNLDNLDAIVVSVPELDLVNLAGMLGVAFCSSKPLSVQETSVIRSILAVMVMVVGSSKALGKTLAELEYYSVHDPLTGLHNRRYFNEMLEYELGRSERHAHEFSILMLDLDDFKDINDTYGHPCGDEALKEVGEVLSARMRKGDLATRIGGDEFAVILTETDQSGAMVVAEKIRSELSDRTFFSPDGKSFHITCSIGVVTFPQDAQNVSDLMAGVDIGLYRAKQMGKDEICSVESVTDTVQAGRDIRDHAEKLRDHLRNDRVLPYFQPIINCRNGKIFAYETLARLAMPNGETISAGMFIETIEKYGMGRELDRVIIRKALEAFKRESSGRHKLFINISAQEIQGRGVLGYAEDICRELGLLPQNLVFELLERDAISDMSNMRKFLTELRKSGFSFALDDFGSGYNSFHYLRELHFEYVKLDGDFVRNILNSKIDFALVKNLIQLCRDLGTLTIAEFVESDEVLRELQAMGVDYAQGFHLGVPLPRMG